MSASPSLVDRKSLSKPRLATLLHWSAYACIGLYATLSAIGFLGSEVNGFDESLQLLGGREVLARHTPHRDFWSLYPPLNYYLNGLAFAVFGSSFIVSRFVSVVVYALTVLAIAQYLRRGLKESAPSVRWATMGLAIFCLTRVLQLSQNNTILGALLLLIYCARKLDFDGRLSRSALLGCGFAGGVLLTMRLNFGAYVLAAIGTTVVVTGEPLGRATWFRQLKQLGTLLLPASAVFLLFLLPYGGFAKEVLGQIALTPNLILRAGHIYDVSQQSTPYYCLLAVIGLALLGSRLAWRNPVPRTVALSVAGVTLILTSFTLWQLSRRSLLLVPYAVPALLIGGLIASQLAWRPFKPSVFLALCFLIANLNHYLIRADGLHLYILGGAVALVTATVTVSEPQLPRVGAMAFLFWLMMQFPLSLNHEGIAQWLWPLNPKAVLPALHVITNRHSFLAVGDSARLTNGDPLTAFERRFFGDADELSVVNYVNQHVAPGEAVYMGLTSHDRTRVNDARLSWMMPRPLASRYLELEPGIITSESAQRDVVRSLRAGVRWLVLQDTPNTGTARYAFQRSTVLDRYIAANYQRAASFGKLHVYCRPDVCP